MAPVSVDDEPSSLPRPRTPADVWFGLLRRLSRGLGERRLVVRGVGFRLEELDFRSGGSAWSFGRVRDVRAVATDVEYDGLVAERVVAECDALVLGTVATASPITLTAVLSPETVQALLDASESALRVVYAHGELRVPWLPGTDLVVEPEVAADDGTVTCRTVAVRSLGQRLSLPEWLPTTTTLCPDLPAGLRLLDLWAQDDGEGVVVRAIVDDPPPATLERRHVRELMVASRRRTEQPTG